MIKKIKIKIEGMTCNGCAKGIEGSIKNLDGVKSINVELNKKTGLIEFDKSKITEKKIFESIINMGYKIIT